MGERSARKPAAVGADISTGLAQIFSSVLGIAEMITALMVFDNLRDEQFEERRVTNI